MSKHFVSGAVALLMVLSPVVVSAQTVPQVPANPTIEQLQALIVQLTTILQQLLQSRQNRTFTNPFGASLSAMAVTESTFNIKINTGTNTAYGFKLDFGDGSTMMLCAPGNCIQSTVTPHGYSVPGTYTITLSAWQGDTTIIATTARVTAGSNPVSNDTNSVKITLPASGSSFAQDQYIPVTVTGTVSRLAYGTINVFQKVAGNWVQLSYGWPVGPSNGSIPTGAFSVNVPNVVFGSNPAITTGPGDYGFQAQMYTYGCGGDDCSPPTNRILATSDIVPITITSKTTNATPVITLTGPTAGASYKVGESIPVSWSYANVPPNSQVLLKLTNVQPSQPISGAISGGGWQGNMLTTTSGSGSYMWPTGPSMLDFTGTYSLTATVRECDSRGCQWNADFPGLTSTVHTYAVSAPVSLIVKTAVTGSAAGSASVSLSSSPAAQTLSAGQTATVANYQFSATGEDVRFATANLVYTDNMPVDPTNCSLFDGSTSISSVSNPVYNANGAAGDYTFSFSPAVVILKGTTKTFSLQCTIPAYATSGSFKWGVKQNAYFSAQGVQSGLPINASVSENYGNVMTIISGGAVVVTTDASTPSFRTVLGGTTDVVSGIYKFRATGESSSLNKVGLKLTSGKSTDLVSVRLYTSWGTQIGSATFVALNTSAVSALAIPLSLPKDTDVTLYVRADYANIGISQPGTAGDVIKIDVDATASQATGLNSGTNIIPSGSTSVAGVQLGGASTATVTVNGSASAASYRNGIDQMRFSYDVNNAPSGSAIQIDLIGSKMPGGKYPLVSPYTLDGTTRTFDLSQAQQTFPSHGTLTFSIGTSESYMPIEGPIRITILNSQGAIIATTNIPTTVVTGTTPVVAPTISVTDATRPNIKYHINNLPTSGVQGVFLAYQPTGTNVTYSTTVSADGSVAMDPVSPSGVYYLKLLGVGNGLLAQSANFTIAPTPVVCPVYQQAMCPAGQTLVNDPATTDANSCTVPHSHCVVPPTVANITTNLPSYAPGATIVVTWSSNSSTLKDWVGMANYGGAWNSALGTENAGWFWAPTTAGMKSLIAPSTPGQYQVVYYLSSTGSGATSQEVARATFTVQAPTPPASVSCTYTPGDSKVGAPPSMGEKKPSTISISGGQSACSSWCSSQGAEAAVFYTCAYNGQAITMSNGASNISNIAFVGAPGTGTVAGVSISLDQEMLSAAQIAQVASVLTAMESLLQEILQTYSF